MDNINIIGMRVMHLKNKMIGTIEKVQNGYVYISFRGNIQKFKYPSAFAEILELEDKDIQEKIEEKGYSSGFESFKNQYKMAIEKEINYLKTTGGHKYEAVDGERLVTNGGDFLYAFDTDTDYHFQEGTPIKIWFPDEIITAYVISCEDFTIMIRTKEYMGEKINSIKFTSEQWILLEALVERLEEMNPTDNSIAYELACKGKSKVNPMSRIVRGQNTAVRRAISEKITFIWGPPGTGKTETLANIALDYIERGQRVLMLSYSNVSVDGALLRIADKADYLEGEIIRYGYPRIKRLVESKTLTSFKCVLSRNPDIEKEYYDLLEKKKKLKKRDEKRKEINKKLKRIREKLSDMEKDLVENAAFVATTISKAVIDRTVFSQTFDAVIFDEASMAYIPQIIFAGGLARKAFICLGDFRQLPAIVQNEEDYLMIQDIFDYSGITTSVENGEGHEWLVMLDKQYRMHKSIADFVSNYMYGGMLKTAEEIIENREEIADIEPLPGDAIAMVDISGTYSVCIKTKEDSRVNLLSALMSIIIAESYIDKYEVGIITPYSAQSRLILAMIRDLQEIDDKYQYLTCATVHQFQGSEKPVIIFDAVDCFRMKYPGTLLTKIKNNTADRLFNVAMTRAQGKFILLVNNDFMHRKKISKNLLFTKVLYDSKRKNSFIDAEEYLELYENVDSDGRILIGDCKNSWDSYIQDILETKDELKIEIPGVLDEDEDLISQLGNCLDELAGKGVDISIRIVDNLIIPNSIKKYCVKNEIVTTPVTIIDKKIIWFGQPLCAADFVSEGEPILSEYFPCIRFEGKYLARQLKAILGI